MPFFAPSCGLVSIGSELMYAHTHTNLFSGAGGKCRSVSSLIALPVMRDDAIDQDLPEEQNFTHTHNTVPYPDCGVMVQYLGLCF